MSYKVTGKKFFERYIEYEKSFKFDKYNFDSVEILDKNVT